MAGFYLGMNRGAGDNPGAIAAGTSTNSTDMELYIVSGTGVTKRDALLFIELLEQYINGNGVADGYPGTYLPPL
jgi:hypothetical protein